MFKKFDESQINDRERPLLPEGHVKFVIQDVDAGVAKSTQGMVTLKLLPIAVMADGTEKKLFKGITRFNIMFPEWEDEDKFAAAKAAKIAKNQKCEVADVADEDIKAAVKIGYDSATENCASAAAAIMGREALPPLPQTINNKKVCPTTGTELDQDTINQMWRAYKAAGVNIIGQIAQGEIEVANGEYEVVARIGHRKWNDEDQHEIKGLYAEVPTGRTLVPGELLEKACR